LSRAYALLGRAEDARANAEACLRQSEGEAPFYIGYAHEALARSAAVAGDESAKLRHLEQATQYLAEVTEERDSALLRADLQSLRGT
jgi:tRNA G26 N,N-dimethylase Trm1